MKTSFAVGVLRPALIIFAMTGIANAQSGNSENRNSVNVPVGVAMVAELDKTVQAKKAKPGDLVKARIVQDVISGGHILVRRGSKLMGHITKAQAAGRENANSVLGVAFDRVALRGGEEMSLNAVLQALAPPIESSNFLAGSLADYNGGNSSGFQPVSHGRDLTVDPRDARSQTRQEALNRAGNPASYATTENTLHNGLLGVGNHGVLGMPGVFLKTDPQGPNAELVSSANNIKLEGGTQVVVGVVAKR
jgi:hypothetical protein